MKRSLQVVIAAVFFVLSLSLPALAGWLDDLNSVVETLTAPGTGLDDATIARGLKEALATGTTRAVASVSRPDGYFGNQMIKILLPEKVRSTAELLSRFGFRQEVDDFVLSMNRAAEQAAPKATEYFVGALKAMTFDDARRILKGDATSATEYFREKTGDKIYAAFKPVVSAKMKEVGVARYYGQMKERFETIPFAGTISSVDLDHYVTTRAVDGLFTTLGEEERRIRTDPAARSTELLKKVFGK